MGPGAAGNIKLRLLEPPRFAGGLYAVFLNIFHGAVHSFFKSKSRIDNLNKIKIN